MDISRRTPADRDRVADALRVGSLLVVVIGHWLMVAVTDGGEITNVLTVIPAMQPLTWVLQVMPLFFLVGGVAHAHTLDSARRRGGTSTGRYAAFVISRATRLLRPTVAFLAAWVVVGIIADRAGWTRGPNGPLLVMALVVVPQLLWFVGIYLGVAGCAPSFYRLHQRHGWWVVVVVCLLAGLADLARFAGDWQVIGNLNFALVWLALHQLGFFWRDERLARPQGLILLGVGAAGLALAITVGPYPRSMVGLPGDAVSNMAPPTVALLCQGLALIGLVVLARPLLARFLERPRPWTAVVVAGRFAMTAFLWHLTALFVVIVVARALHLDQPPLGSVTWWATRPLWFAILVVPTALLVAVFLRFDSAPTDRRPVEETRSWVDPLAGLGVAVVFVGILMISIAGVDVLGNRPAYFLVGDIVPITGFAVFGLGLVALSAARPRRATDPAAGPSGAATRAGEWRATEHSPPTGVS